MNILFTPFVKILAISKRCITFANENALVHRLQKNFEGTQSPLFYLAK